MRRFLMASLCAGFGLWSIAVQASPRVAVLELHNDTGERLARFDSASEDILASTLRNSNCCQVLDRGQVSSRLLTQPIRLHEVYDRLDRAAALGQALQVDYLVTGRALHYGQDGLHHRMEFELMVVDVRQASYAFRQRFEVETRGDMDRKQHRSLLDQLAARVLTPVIEAMDLGLDLTSDPYPGVQLAEASPPPTPQVPPSPTQMPPPAIYSAPIGGPPRQTHRVPQEAAWGLPEEAAPSNPLAAWGSQLMDQALAGLSDEDRQKVLEAMNASISPTLREPTRKRETRQRVPEQPVADEAAPSDPLEKAWQMIEQRRLASARPLLEKALRKALETGDQTREARARDGLCEVDRRQSAPQMLAPALVHGWLAVDLHRQLRQPVELSAALRRVAGIEAATGHGAQALETLHQAWTLTEGDAKTSWINERAEIRLAMAAARLALGDPEGARRELLTVLEHWRHHDQRLRQAQLLNQLAQLDASLGRIGDADEHLLGVLRLYDVDTAHFDLEELFRDIERLAPSGLSMAIGMGMSQVMGAYAAALDGDGDADRDTTSGPRPSWDPDFDALLEEAYRHVLASTSADPSSFIRNHHLLQAQLATTVQPAGFDGHLAPIVDAPREVLCAFFERSEVLQKRGRLYQQLGRNRAADTLRQEAWDAWLDTSGRLYAILMRSMLPQGAQVPLPAMGSVYAAQAREVGGFPPFPFLPPLCRIADFHQNELWRAETYAAAGQLGIARSVYKGFAMAAPHARVESLIGAAQLEDQLGHPDAAIDLYRDALDRSDTLLDSLAMEPSAYAARLSAAYDALVQLLVERGDLDDAFRTTERARAYALHRQLAGRISELPTAVGLDIARQEVVSQGSTLVVYFTLPEETLAWIIDAQGAHLERLPVPRQQLDTAVTLLLDALSLEQPFEEPSSHLFDVLVRPLLPHLKHNNVTVVPHGVLHYVPMAALWDDRLDRFLLDDLRLTTAPSVTAIRHLRRRPQLPIEGALVMGNPDASLDFAEQEARTVASRLGAQTHLRRDASKERFLAQAGGTGILHLAAHGTFDTYNPMQSHLQLAPDDASGRLTAAEIFGLDLEATGLVVLSACQTGLGELTRGDDIVGLNRAFLVAGASSVLTTLWRVDDASTAALMDHFYRQLPEVGPAEALRRAQRAVRAEPGWSHPYFWAGFRLSGVGQPRGLF